MKLFFILALLCISLVSFSQIDNRIIHDCGYSSESLANSGYLNSRYRDILPDEEYVNNSMEISWSSTAGSWCYKYTVRTIHALNKKDEPVPDVAKLITQLPCNIKVE